MIYCNKQKQLVKVLLISAVVLVLCTSCTLEDFISRNSQSHSAQNRVTEVDCNAPQPRQNEKTEKDSKEEELNSQAGKKDMSQMTQSKGQSTARDFQAERKYQKEQQPLVAVFRTNSNSASYTPNKATLIVDQSALKNYIVTKEGEFDLGQENESGHSFYDLPELYGKDFFAENSLVLLYIEETSMSVQHEVTSVQYRAEDAQLVLEVKVQSPGEGEYGLMAKGYWHLVVAVPKVPVGTELVVHYHK